MAHGDRPRGITPALSRAERETMTTKIDGNEASASTHGYVALLGALGFAEGNNSDDAEEYYSEQKYRHTDGLGEDDISQDAVTMLKWAKVMNDENDRLLHSLRGIAEQLKQWAIQSGRQCSNCEEDEHVEYYAGRKDAFSDAYQLIPEDVLTDRG